MGSVDISTITPPCSSSLAAKTLSTCSSCFSDNTGTGDGEEEELAETDMGRTFKQIPKVFLNLPENQTIQIKKEHNPNL